jgi:hypothetical protein
MLVGNCVVAVTFCFNVGDYHKCYAKCHGFIYMHPRIVTFSTLKASKIQYLQTYLYHKTLDVQEEDG